MEVPWLTYQQFGNLVGNLTDIIVEEENWQPMIDAAREMRSPEDYDDKFSTVKNDFLRTWHHSRSAKPISLEEMMEDEDGNIYSVIRDIKKKIAALLDWLKEVKEELAKPQTPDLFALLQAYFNQRNAGAYSQRARVNNLKEYSELCQYLLDHGITDITTLEAHVSDLRATTDSLKKKLDTQTAELKLLRKIPEYFADYKRLKPVFDGFQKIKFSKAREKYRAEHAADLKRFYEARRIISQKFPDGKFDRKALEAEYAELEQQHDATYSEFKAIRAESQTLWKIKSHIDTARKNIEPIQINAPTQKQEKEI